MSQTSDFRLVGSRIVVVVDVFVVDEVLGAEEAVADGLEAVGQGVPGSDHREEQGGRDHRLGHPVLHPRWSDPEYALAHGFQSIGDGFLGAEHFINDEYIDDDTILDPKPESLVWTRPRVSVASWPPCTCSIGAPRWRTRRTSAGR